MRFTEVKKLEDGTVIVKDGIGNLFSLKKVENAPKATPPKSNDVTRKIKSILKELKIPQEISGFNYLLTAISLLNENPDYYYSIVNVLYPKIANLHKKEHGSMIERSLRHAISKVDQSTDTYHKIFGGITELTNKRFLITIANYLND